VAVSAALSLTPQALARPSGPLVPRTGALLGAYIDPDARWLGDTAAKAEINNFERMLGRQVAIDHHFYSWWDSFPGELERFDAANGRVPLVTWEPWGASLRAIAGRSHDTLIRKRARALAQYRKPVFLRWGHEMNGNWYPWGGSHNNGAKRYVAAWRHLHDVFEEEGARNVIWVWCPNADDVPSQNWNNFTNYYPGDSYVDWVGIDGYNWGTTRSWSSWRSFASLFSRVYGVYDNRKPIMIAETGSAERGGGKAGWITYAGWTMRNTFPSVAAFVWFDVRKENDWRVNSSQSALRSFSDVADGAYFATTGR
jgi:hypothetical protein